MIKTEILNVNGHLVQSVHINAPGGEGHPNMLVLVCQKGYIMCGYLNLGTSDAVADAACVIGGVSMSGGRGSVVGTFLGALIISIIAKALPLINVPSIAQNTVKGVIILVVVIFNVITQRMVDRQNLERREM